MTRLARGLAYGRSIWDYRYFWFSLVKSDLRRRYRNSILGVGWSLLNPLLMTGVLSLVYSQAFHVSFTEFGPFLLTGLAFWGFLSGAVQQSCTCFPQVESYLRQQPAPLAIYTLRLTLSLAFHFVIALAVVSLFSWVLQGPPSVESLVLLPPVVVGLFFLAWALSTLTAFATVYFPDLQHIAECGLQILFFLTPIAYPPKILVDKGWAAALRYNPLAGFVQTLRRALLPQASASLEPAQLVVMIVFAVTVVGLAVLVVSRLEKQIIFEL